MPGATFTATPLRVTEYCRYNIFYRVGFLFCVAKPSGHQQEPPESFVHNFPNPPRTPTWGLDTAEQPLDHLGNRSWLRLEFPDHVRSHSAGLQPPSPPRCRLYSDPDTRPTPPLLGPFLGISPVVPSAVHHQPGTLQLRGTIHDVGEVQTLRRYCGSPEHDGFPEPRAPKILRTFRFQLQQRALGTTTRATTPSSPPPPCEKRFWTQATTCSPKLALMTLFGCNGLRSDDPQAFQPSLWPGLNLLGGILMKIRSQMYPLHPRVGPLPTHPPPASPPPVTAYTRSAHLNLLRP